MRIKEKILSIYVFTSLITLSCFSQQTPTTIWSIGKPDHSANEFALAPNGFKDFVGHDFGYEDKFYLVGFSKERNDFPYVLPGPVDTWGGTWPTAGWRTNQVNILFGVKKLPVNGDYKFVIKLSDFAKKFLPLIKVSINGQDEEMQLTADGYNVASQPHPRQNESYIDSADLKGDISSATAKTIEIPVKKNVIKKGGNTITITITQGSWIMFDEISLQGSPGTSLEKPGQMFIRNVKAAGYELETDGQKFQPLLVNAQHLKGAPNLSVELDNKIIFKQAVEKGNYVFEALMPAVTQSKQSRYKILENGKVIEEGVVSRAKQKLQTLADYVDTRMGTAHSRWMIAPGPWMPFSMVKMSPDNQNAGWQAGYEPAYESIGTFSHIHEWTMAGLGIFATNGKLKTKIGDELKPGSGYRSRIDKRSEEAPIGYYKADLTDYNIKAEVTATTRCGFERFTFPSDRDSARILVDFHIPAEYNYQVKEIDLKKVNDYRIEGFAHQVSPNVWSTDASQDYTIHFVIEFDKPIQKMGSWINDTIQYIDILEAKNIKNAGLFLQFDAKKDPVVQVRSSISWVSIANANQNLKREITKPFGWNFDAIRQNQVNVWNDIFNRVKITNTKLVDKIVFYYSM
jgi:hypothetical protein